MMTRGQYEELARLLPELYSAQTANSFPRHSLAVVAQMIRAENSGFAGPLSNQVSYSPLRHNHAGLLQRK
jgi:hypothetical protein